MLDIQFIKENPQKVKKACKDKGLDEEVVDRLLRVDEQRRKLIKTIEEARNKRNLLLKDIKTKPDQNIISQGKNLKELLAKLEPDLRAIEEQYNNLMLQIPSIPAKEVPVGQKPTIIRKWGNIPEFNFPIKDHIQLGQDLDLIDFERGSKVAGFRGYFLKNEAVLMHLGIIDYALKQLIKKGFVPFTAPVVDKEFAFFNTGHFPWGKKEAYGLSSSEAEIDKAKEGEDLQYLAGTSEVPMVSYHQNEMFSEKDLPKKYAAFSPGYRREIGNYGKDTKGIYRVHEILKIEQIIICKNDWQESEKWLEELAQNSEEILKDLKIPYHVCLMPTGDMGEPQVKKYDIEAWMQGRKEYGEVMSDSIMGEFQARRANIKYKTKKGEVKYVHTLNNTAIATPRILIAILENYQQKDGSIKIPKVLQPYIGKEVIYPKVS